jgi:hypothetical protein
MHMGNTLKGTNVEFNKNTKQKIIKINSGYFWVPPRMPIRVHTVTAQKNNRVLWYYVITCVEKRVKGIVILKSTFLPILIWGAQILHLEYNFA